jgi:predicted signal transduction protein with EAL and GGDEF domain
MASLAGTTLLWPGTRLDGMWALNASAFKQLVPFGRAIGVPFLVLGLALFAAGVGWFGQRRWGWKLAVAIIAIQIADDLASMLSGNIIRGAAGVSIAGTLFFYMTSSPVRAVFAKSDIQTSH